MTRISRFLFLLCLCLTLCIALPAQAATYDCDCTDIHIHVVLNGCYALTCEQANHKHDETCYDLSQAVCGIPYKAHKLTCLSEEKQKAESTFNAEKVSVTAALRAVPHYSYVSSRAYQSGYHYFWDNEMDGYTVAQIFTLADVSSTAPGKTWTSSPANALYDVTAAEDYNYFLTYCLDKYSHGVSFFKVPYRIINLEDSGYFDPSQANYLRALMSRAFPAASLTEIQQRLIQLGMDSETVLDMGEDEMITATQLAIWEYSNPENETPLSQRYDYHLTIPQSRRGGIAVNLNPKGSGNYMAYEHVEDRILEAAELMVLDALQNPIAPTENQIVISSAAIADLIITPGEAGYTARLTIELNHGYEPHEGVEGVTITASTPSGATASASVNSQKEYALTLDDYQIGEEITILLEGEQRLDLGVYMFQAYAEYPEDRRNASQNMIGLASGTVPVGEKTVLKPAAISLLKTDVDAVPLQGVSFDLYYNSVHDQDVFIASYTTDENGVITIADLMSGGSYLLQETATLPGLELLRTPIAFSITTGKEPAITLTQNASGAATANAMTITAINREIPPSPPPVIPDIPDVPEEPEVPPMPDIPQTGDDTQLLLLAAMLLFSGAMLFILLRRRAA